jgi:hypothetical protein
VRTKEVKTTTKLAQACLVAVAVLGVLGCESRTDRTDGGGVLLSITDHQFGNITIPISVNGTGLFVQADSITLQNIVKDPDGSSSPLMNVELDSYQITYRRVDQGTRTPPTFTEAIFGVVPAGGTDSINNFNLLGPEQLTNPPLSDLLAVNGGFDRETGSPVISLELGITFFGRTLSGDRVASNTARTRLDFSP